MINARNMEISGGIISRAWNEKILFVLAERLKSPRIHNKFCFKAGGVNGHSD